MTLADGFFAPDLFLPAPGPRIAAAWMRIRMGDADGAAFFADDVNEAETGPGPLAQLRAAVAVLRGDAAAAADILADVLSRLSGDAPVALWLQRAVCARACGRLGEAAAAFDRAASLAPDRAATHLDRALLLWDVRGAAAGRDAFRTGISTAETPELWAAWARRERAAGQAEAARAVLDDALARFPADPDLINVSAAWFLGEKRYGEALATLDRLGGNAASHPIVLVNRGSACLGLRRFDAARAAFAAARAAAPDMIAAGFGLATAAFETGDDAAAEAELKTVLAVESGHAEARLMLARLLARTRREGEACARLKNWLAETPDDFDLHYQLAVTLNTVEAYGEAETHVRAALALRPEARELYDLLGLLRLACGDFAAARDAFAAACKTRLQRTPAFASNRLYAMHYEPDVGPDDLAAAHYAYGARFGGAGDDPDAVFANSPEPERRLRIGYVSPDFRAHSVAFFMMTPFDRHDRSRFEVFAYSNARREDGATSWFAEVADHWRDVRRLTPEEIRTRIRADGIDILVDLAGHTGDNLLPVFARRAAPVQVSYLGYPDTTGLPSIDCRLVDAITDPSGPADARASERLIRMPGSFLCYRPTADAPEVAAGLLAAGRPMTFGSFNAAVKMNPPLYDAWAAILAATPGSRLLLKAKQFGDDRARDWVRRSFAARGIAAERIDIRAFAPTLGDHLNLYGEIDLALDTFPYNGTTTTCEALYMGVPVLTLVGGWHCARVGESLIRAIGHAEGFLAADAADYVRRAVDWAGRREDLAAVRRGLRARLLASPVCDEAGFVTALEEAYRAMWRHWCAGEGARGGLGPSPFERELQAACART